MNQARITNLRPLSTLKPSTNSKIISTKLAETIIKSKIFQPHKKKSFDNAINLIMHSNVKIDVNTCVEDIALRNLYRTIMIILYFVSNI